MSFVPTIAWEGGPDGALLLLDQTKLPGRIEQARITTVEECRDAIQRLVVRGAPAIGIAAAYGVVLAARGDAATRDARIEGALDRLDVRPTAVNLGWALTRQKSVHDRATTTGADVAAALLAGARRIHDEDAALCDAIGEHGAKALLGHGKNVLTHCNTGRLATGGIGTALGAIKVAHRHCGDLRVWADETRPLLQGARLTAFELDEAGIDYTLLSDSAGPAVIMSGRIDAVIAGADRVAANGDTANKIGTLPLALACARKGVPFYFACPTTTIDAALPGGDRIEIERRCPDEVLGHLEGRVPAGARAYNPAFDVTPADLVTALVTEHGVLHAPGAAGIKALLARGR